MVTAKDENERGKFIPDCEFIGVPTVTDSFAYLGSQTAEVTNFFKLNALSVRYMQIKQTKIY